MTLCRKCGKEIPDGEELCEDCKNEESQMDEAYLEELMQSMSDEEKEPENAGEPAPVMDEQVEEKPAEEKPAEEASDGEADVNELLTLLSQDYEDYDEPDSAVQPEEEVQTAEPMDESPAETSLFREDDEESDAMFLDIQGNLSGLIEVPAEDEEEKEPSPLTLTDIASVLSDSGLSEEQTAVIEKTYEDTFGEDLPSAEHLVDPKLVEANAKRKEKLELVEQVESLKHQLEETRSIPVDDSDDDVPAVKTYDVILRVKPEKVGQIHSDTINGQKCLIIPMDENEHAAVNGVNTTI